MIMIENGLIKYSVYFVPENKDPDCIIDILFDEKLINESCISGISHYAAINETLNINEVENKRQELIKRIKELDKWIQHKLEN